MTTPQPAILPAIPNQARFIELYAIPDRDPKPVLKSLAGLDINEQLLVGLGAGFVHGLGKSVEGLHAFQSKSGPGCEVPSTQADLLLWIRGDDRGQIARSARKLLQLLAPGFDVARATNAFSYETGLDLTGYEDGTENPEGDDANDAAFLQNTGNGLDGSSFVAVQKWEHNLNYFDSLPEPARNDIFGRQISDNEEMDDAPVSAHVKRTAQESFDPEAFVLRRSMPWSDPTGEGLIFVAFGKSFDAFEALLHRMTGGEDGNLDALFRFSRPVTGANYWCPPVRNGTLDLTAIDL